MSFPSYTFTNSFSFNTSPVGLRFYWYEFEQVEDHGKYWGQLCGSMHRLVFVREEFNAISEISDIDTNSI